MPLLPISSDRNRRFLGGRLPSSGASRPRRPRWRPDEFSCPPSRYLPADSSAEMPPGGALPIVVDSPFYGHAEARQPQYSLKIGLRIPFFRLFSPSLRRRT